MRGSWLLFLALVAFPTPVRAQDVPETAPLVLSRLQGSVVLDGIVDEPAWNLVEPFPLTVQGPSYHSSLSQKTEIRVAYDDEYLYVSCRCFDTNPEEILTTGYKRDQWSSSFDQFAIILDTFDDHENALVFVVSSLGVRIDAALFNDGNEFSGGSATNQSWNTFWDAESRITPDGWSSEARILFSSLKFDSGGDTVTMGLIVYRYIARDREIQVFPDIPPNWGFLSFLKPSRARLVQFEGIEPRNALYVTPYALGGLTQTHDLNEAETGYVRDDDFSREAGLDLKYGLTSDLTMDVTLNTDFAQVEADDEQVNLSRFSLFFPEKRRFFLERSSNFDFAFGNRESVFYSRRIGLDEDSGERIPLIGGVRVVGRVGAWDIGMMNLQSARNRIRPSENYGVLRLRRQVFNPNTYVGGILTTLVDENGSYNVVYGADGLFRLFGDDYLMLEAAQTAQTDGGAGIDAARLRFKVEGQRYLGLSYALQFSWAGEDYLPALGFEQREDFWQTAQRIGYGWAPGEQSIISQHRLFIRSNWYVRNVDGKTDTYRLEANWDGFTRKGIEFSANLRRTFDSLTDSFDVSDEVVVDAGDYTLYEARIGLQTSASRPIYVSNDLDIGSFYGGTRISVGVQPTWNASPVLSLGGAYQYNFVDFPDRGVHFIAHIARFRAEITLNRAVSASAFIQYNGADDISLVNFRLRYNPREGNDLYLVYNEGFNTDRFSARPSLPLTDERTLVVKYSHTFLW